MFYGLRWAIVKLNIIKSNRYNIRANNKGKRKTKYRNSDILTYIKWLN